MFACNECHGSTTALHVGGVAGYNSLGYPYPDEWETPCEHCSGEGFEPCEHHKDRPAEVISDNLFWCNECWSDNEKDNGELWTKLVELLGEDYAEILWNSYILPRPGEFENNAKFALRIANMTNLSLH